MHNASILGEHLHDAVHYGWDIDAEKAKNTWTTLVEHVQDHVGSLNWGYSYVTTILIIVCVCFSCHRCTHFSLEQALREAGINYINALGTFVDPHTIECVDRSKQVTRITGQHILIAVGGRPTQLDIPGGEYSITSDDIFSLRTPPGKTLVVGASCIQRSIIIRLRSRCCLGMCWIFERTWV